MSAFYRVIRAVIYPILFLVFRVKIKGRQNIPQKGSFVLCCNHVSMIDVVVLIVAFNRQIYFMAKEELFRNSFISWLFKKMGAFAVRRGKGDSSAIQRAMDIVKDGRVLGIFPEGTRSKDGQLLRAKSGAALIASSTGAPILPVAIRYYGKVRPFCRITLNIGKPIEPEHFHINEMSTSELRRASTVIMDGIRHLWEEKI